MKKNKDEKKRGGEAFDSFYSDLFGERWEKLKASLLAEPIYSELQFDGCETYFLDPASLASSLCLPVKDSETTLDLCAAPGGKTLVLSGNIKESSQLVANERSALRKERLSRVIKSCLPPEISDRISVTCRDGALLCQREKEMYDSILLDAPCSSERHVMVSPKYLDQWSPSRIKSLSVEQWALLSCAYRILKKDGFLLYSTCALPPNENDMIIERLKKKFPSASVLNRESMKKVFDENKRNFKASIHSSLDLDSVFSFAEKTEYGLHILPDTSSGAGPLYFSLIQKL